MDSLILGCLPGELQQLIKAGAPPAQVAQHASSTIERMTSAEEQSAMGRFILKILIERADQAQRAIAERALEVMDKFPSFPRPRAAVVRQALKSLAQGL